MDKYLISREEIDSLDGLQKTHFLNENARRVNKSLGDLTGLTGFGFHIIEAEPGFETTKMHKHYHEDECVYVMEGEADATIGDDVIKIKAGDFLGYRAGGLAHTIVNTGSTTLRCIVVGQRLEHDVGDYPRLTRLFRQKGMPWNLVDPGAISEPVAGIKTRD
jgi:uncharacterized cupin superfamily protein